MCISTVCPPKKAIEHPRNWLDHGMGATTQLEEAGIGRKEESGGDKETEGRVRGRCAERREGVRGEGGHYRMQQQHFRLPLTMGRGGVDGAK